MNGSKFPAWVVLAAQVGFPAVVAFYVLVELRASLDQLTIAITEFSTKMQLLLALVQRG